MLIESWRRHFNTVRPHSSLGYVPPAPEAVTDMTQRAGDASARADAAMNAQWKLTLAAMHKLVD